MKSITILLGLTASACAFTVGPSISSRIERDVSSHGFLQMSEPSDTSGDDLFEYQDVVNVESEEYEPTQSEALVSNVMDLMPSLLEQVSSETRAAINEALYKLEGLNPTKESPTVSPLLNGIWSLRYVGGYTR